MNNSIFLILDILSLVYHALYQCKVPFIIRIEVTSLIIVAFLTHCYSTKTSWTLINELQHFLDFGHIWTIYWIWGFCAVITSSGRLICLPNIIIPRVMEGYRYEPVRPSVCLVLPKLYLKDYSSDHFQILYIDSTLLEDVQPCSFGWKNWKLSKLSNFEYLWGIFRLNVYLCPGCFSKTIHRIVFKLHKMILQILKLCNVVVLIGKIENCQNNRILKIYEDDWSDRFQFCILFLQIL